MKNKFLFLLLIISGALRASDSVVCKVNVITTFFTVDALYNLYFINNENEIIKTDFNNSSNFSYSNKNLGRPSLIDASNPMKVLVFYPDQQTIILLDNQLAELSALTLKGNITAQNYQPSSICKHSGTDHIWMYDELSRKLIRLDEGGNVLAMSEAFDQLFDFSPEITALFSVNDKVYADTKEEGILIFDAYASYVQTIPLNIEVNQVNDKYIFGLAAQKIEIFNLNSGESTISLTTSLADQVMMMGKQLYIRNNEGISIILPEDVR